jgi:hypothetical protein
MNRACSTLTGAARQYRAGLLGLALLAGLLVQAASACQVCIPMPVKTLADRLLEADALVLAREDPARPFHYATVEVLKGDPGEAPIDAFLPSTERRLLAHCPQRRMLLARAKPGGGWSALGIADADYERVVRRILQYAGSWRPMEAANRQRLATFVPLLGHSDSRLHETAYLEIARAPYTEIRRIAAEVPIETVRDMLDEPRYLEWRGLAILMLAQSESPAGRERVKATFDYKQRLGSTFNLAAWATAYLAIEGASGVEQIQRWYLTRPDRSLEELQEIVKALSVIASAEPPMREQVATAYRALLAEHPSLAPDIIHDLMAWRRWDFVEQVRGIRAAIAEQHPLAAYALDLYLRAAARAARSDPASPSIFETGRAPGGVER